MDPKIWILLCKNSRARNEKDQELKYMVHLLEVGDVVSMVNDSMRDMESHIRIFKESHE